jgi:hypothetical protein
MKVYVAFRTDVDPPTRDASPSFTKLKEAMKGAGAGAEFTVVLYDFKPNVANVCQAIMDVTELDADSATDYRINDHGQLREVK